MTKHSVTHRPDCDLEGQSEFMLAYISKFKWCPRCGVPYSQVVVDPSSLERTSIAYPTIFTFRDARTGKPYQYYLRSGLAKIEDVQDDVSVWTGSDIEHDGDISLGDWLRLLPSMTDYKFTVGTSEATQDDCAGCGGTLQ